ncbi:hypothetical protein I5R65_08145 [Herbaspirillum sp. AP02]|uniref:hypothetical protein n=1 Tax=unclassified Herbaspirillum TaxID=2624150 RepID=UPI0015D9ECD4|nr:MULTISPECIES: hypothetical protein [unclassified Herbaspirillum]MBG7619433.1 hypothetical protein [Herbaspirillum sp. AP02]NZD66717.1 hypothetical protein [Herbaspirillum sp. AP21]
MNKTRTYPLIAMMTLMLVLQTQRSETATAANVAALDISVVVAEKCRIDFSEGSADFFQVCSVGPDADSERRQQVTGAAIALAPQDDPYFLERDPEQSQRQAGASASPTGASTSAQARRGPRVVVIPY